MKCYKPHTDQYCEVFISTDEKIYAEYILNPETDARSSKPNIFESFIPVCDGEQITVNVTFKGTVLHGAVDILADGAFVYDRRIEGDKTGKVKFQKRAWKLQEFYNVPTGKTDTATMQTGRGVVAGNLLIKSLEEGDVPLYVKNGGKLGLGTIAVIISLNQDTEETYRQHYQHQTVGKWRDIRTNHADGGIKPVHELEFRLEDDEVHFNRQQRHRRHKEQLRFGMNPWAMFVFHYRSQAAIQAAGCVARPNNLLQLEPHLGGFTFADPDAIVKKRLATRYENDNKKLEEEMVEEENSDFGGDGYDTFSNTRSVSESDGLFVSRSPSHGATEMPRRRLFGNSLGMQSVQSDDPRRDSHISGDEMAADLRPGQLPGGDLQDLFRDHAVDDSIMAAQPEQAAGGQAGPENSIPGTNHDDTFDFTYYPNVSDEGLTREIDHALYASGFDIPQAPAAAPIANMVVSTPDQNQSALSEHTAPGDVVRSVETDHQHSLPHHPQLSSSEMDDAEQVEPSPLAQMVSNAVQHKVDKHQAAKTARIEAKAAKKERPPPAPKGKPVFDPTAKTGYGYGNVKMAQRQSMAPTQEAMRHLDAEDQQVKGVLQDYLQDQSGMQQYAQAPHPTKPAVPYQRPWETTQPRQPIQYPMSPPNKLVHPAVATLSAPSSPQPAPTSPYTPTTTSAVPRKRSASIISRGSTPGKRARLAEHAAERAALAARLEDKKKAKEAATKKLEEERKAREEMERRREEEERIEREAEEAAEAELEAMRAELEAEEAEVNDIQATRRSEAEEARMKELERQRDMEGEQ